MMHYLKSGDGTVEFSVCFFCSYLGNSEARNCDGNCHVCRNCKAELSADVMLNLLERADCNHSQ